MPAPWSRWGRAARRRRVEQWREALRAVGERDDYQVVALLHVQEQFPVPEFGAALAVDADLAVRGCQDGRDVVLAAVLARRPDGDDEVFLLVSLELWPMAWPQYWSLQVDGRGSGRPVRGLASAAWPPGWSPQLTAGLAVGECLTVAAGRITWSRRLSSPGVRWSSAADPGDELAAVLTERVALLVHLAPCVEGVS